MKSFSLKSFSLKCGFLFVLLMGIAEVNAQQVLDASIVNDLKVNTKYGFVLTEERHFKGVLEMYDLLINSGVPITDYEIVVKGKVVTQLTKGSELEQVFQAYRGKVRVSVCSVAMRILQVPEDSLFAGLDVIPTASVRMLQLQAQGYNTLTY
jgi:intracellular sulfur oxidation DsrE/DsrF family protein